MQSSEPPATSANLEARPRKTPSSGAGCLSGLVGLSNGPSVAADVSRPRCDVFACQENMLLDNLVDAS